MIFQEYKLYAEQKENFIDRNFQTNKFYMVSFVAIIFAMIFTGNVVFMSKISATLVFSLIGISVCALWWMNVDAYNTLIKVKYANVLEALEEKLPVKPFTDEFKGKTFRRSQTLHERKRFNQKEYSSEYSSQPALLWQTPAGE